MLNAHRAVMVGSLVVSETRKLFIFPSSPQVSKVGELWDEAMW
jgi:hypothetical protein